MVPLRYAGRWRSYLAGGGLVLIVATELCLASLAHLTRHLDPGGTPLAGASDTSRASVSASSDRNESEDGPKATDLVIALAAAVSACFAGALWRSTDKLWAETKRLATGAEDQLAENAKLIKATQKAAAAAERHAAASETILNRLESPRVYPHQISFVPDDPRKTVIVTLKNFGRSVAIIDRIAVAVVLSDSKNVSSKILHQQKDFMPPGALGEKEITDHFSTFAPRIALNKDKIYSGEFTLSVCVSADYEDLLGARRGGATWFVWNKHRGAFVPGVEVWEQP